MSRSTSAKCTIASNCRSISCRVRPKSPAPRYTFSRPVNSGWKPAPSSISETTCPPTRTTPLVGHVTRETSLRSVVLPAPLRPMMPNPAPTGISSDTSRSAKMVELILPREAVWTSSVCPRRSRIFDATRSPSVRARPVRYFLVTLSSWIAIDIRLDHIREILVHLLEHHERARKQGDRDGGRNRHDAPVGGAVEYQRGSEALDNCRQRIQRE